MVVKIKKLLRYSLQMYFLRTVFFYFMLEYAYVHYKVKLETCLNHAYCSSVFMQIWPQFKPPYSMFFIPSHIVIYLRSFIALRVRSSTYSKMQYLFSTEVSLEAASLETMGFGEILNPTSHGRFRATPYMGGGHFVPPPYFLSMFY